MMTHHPCICHLKSVSANQSDRASWSWTPHILAPGVDKMAAETSPPAAVSATQIVSFLSFSNWATSLAITLSCGGRSCSVMVDIVLRWCLVLNCGLTMSERLTSNLKLAAWLCFYAQSMSTSCRIMNWRPIFAGSFGLHCRWIQYRGTLEAVRCWWSCELNCCSNMATMNDDTKQSIPGFSSQRRCLPHNDHRFLMLFSRLCCPNWCGWYLFQYKFTCLPFARVMYDWQQMLSTIHQCLFMYTTMNDSGSWSDYSFDKASVCRNVQHWPSYSS